MPTCCTARPSICIGLIRLVTKATALIKPRLELTLTISPVLTPTDSAKDSLISTNCSGWVMALSKACLVQ